MKLKQAVSVMLILLMAITITGCDTKDEDVEIQSYRHYINTSETVIAKSTIAENEDGGIRVELIFDKPIK